MVKAAAPMTRTPPERTTVIGVAAATLVAREFLVDFGSRRLHQVRLEGGDASEYCYP
jgi:hypothetical protein